MDFDFLKWIDHSAFVMHANGRTVYVDPFNLKGNMERADLIFITHSHFDHMSIKDITMISRPDTQFIAPAETAAKLSGRNVLAVERGRIMMYWA